ncbi:uncharacterized protein C8orf74 homolog [Rhopilema esculentum]|uniref:uncharacterized protein C8orf74 homolog n=1 Tax=Rhopilema esculentum TaxID=499914 RepID=UPI0031D65332|eukprot:gene7875-13753_t
MADNREELRISELLDVSNISIEDLQEIYFASSRSEKREILLTKLEIQDICEESELRKAILLDFSLEAIIFASGHGFSWKSTQSALAFLVNLLEKTAFKGLCLEDAIIVFRSMIHEIQVNFLAGEMKALVDYTLQTLFRHYNLYLFCMTNDQEIDLREESLEVKVPITPEPLTKGVELEKWKYLQSIEQMQNEQSNLKTIRDQKLHSNIEKIEQASEETHHQLAVAFETQDADEFPKIVEALTKLHVEQIDAELQKSVEESKDKLDFIMKRNNISQPNSARLRPVSHNRPKSKQKK